MIYCSIDIETSGLDPNNNSILSMSVLVENTVSKLPFEEIPKFSAIILQTNIIGHPKALAMNKDILEHLSIYDTLDADQRKIYSEKIKYNFFNKEEVVKELYKFLFINGHYYDLTNVNYSIYENDRRLPKIDENSKPITINVAGKNFSTFDKLFIEKLPLWNKIVRARQRTIDPSILFVDWNTDVTMPSLGDCKKRANIEGEVAHDSTSDAWDVIQLLRKFY